MIFARNASPDRTKAALAQAKQRGVVLGTRTNLAVAQAKGAKAARAAADAFAANVLPIIQQLRAQGITTMRQIASALNERNVHTARGGEWSVSSVHDLMHRMV